MSDLIPLMSPRALDGLIRRGEAVHLVDVRDPAAFARGHVPGARSVPLDLMDPLHLADALRHERAGREEPLYLICDDGARAEEAARRLRGQGLRNLRLIDGGTRSWEGAGLPLARPRPRLSPERQALLAVGGLILALLVKGALVHPAFYAGLGLLGAAMILAGLTAPPRLDAVLARLPWNRDQAGGRIPAMR
jgi:rhodanese-related sulfurtransferase